VLHTQPGAHGSSARPIAGAATTVTGNAANTSAKAPMLQRTSGFPSAGPIANLVMSVLLPAAYQLRHSMQALARLGSVLI
jgi:hypothetical protein